MQSQAAWLQISSSYLSSWCVTNVEFHFALLLFVQNQDGIWKKYFWPSKRCQLSNFIKLKNVSNNKHFLFSFLGNHHIDSSGNRTTKNNITSTYLIFLNHLEYSPPEIRFFYLFLRVGNNDFSRNFCHFVLLLRAQEKV